ncbi:TPA: hypothetical protein TVE92_001789 [Streptococcus equi subsp. zooepidemicus]|nr:hypothetical protein [Streptococcus equi subsp. zooepidemicus]
MELSSLKKAELEIKAAFRAEQVPSQVVGILNTPTLNSLFSIDPKQAPDNINRLLENEAQFNLLSADKEHTASLFIEHYMDVTRIKLRTKKLLDFVVMRFSERNPYKKANSTVNVKVTFTLEEYADILGKPNPKSKSTKKDVRRILKDALDAIYSYSIETSEKRGAELRYFSKMRICQSYSVKNGVYEVTLGNQFAEFLISSYIMQFPLSLFTLDERGSNPYVIGRKLALHQSIKKNQKKGTNKIISVKSLLKVASEIPTIEDVRKSNGSWSKRIEEKLTEALDKLGSKNNDKGEKIGIEFLEYWEYCNSKGKPISDEQLVDMSYYIFSELYVSFSVRGIN